MKNLDHELSRAVRHFWSTRQRQASRQGSASGLKDQGARQAVTGGAQMNGFVQIVAQLLREAGLDESAIHFQRRLELPGFFRAEKKWDLVVVADGKFLAAVEFKSHVGPSFGNNYNNRTEESLGSASDIWAAYREGVFAPSTRPWLGYLMLLEDCPASSAPVAVKEPHFRVLDEFRGASYAKRYEMLITKLVRERLYDAGCLLVSRQGSRPTWDEPNPELSFRGFASSLLAQAAAFVRTR